ncbi:MAG TPA: hypothetical protein VM639_13110 [Dongiaceae bacterium]|nr:hypothetical protein [Dongiaceae bacterium]
MTIRTTTTSVIFHYPFILSGLDERQPAGTYQVETDEEQIEDVSFVAFRRLSTLIHLHATQERPGIMQTMTVDPKELELALARDGETEGADSPDGERPAMS